MEDSEKPKIEETKADDESPKDVKVEDKTHEADDETKKAFSNIASALVGIQATLKSLDERTAKTEKAMEEPTDFPLKPKGTADEEDVGADTKVPAKPYVSNSEQASLHDDKSGDNKPIDDEAGLSMQEKRTVTRTIENDVRPGQSGVGVNKTSSPNGQIEERIENPILKAFRTKGIQNAELIARDIHAKKYDYIAKDQSHVWSPGADY